MWKILGVSSGRTGQVFPPFTLPNASQLIGLSHLSSSPFWRGATNGAVTRVGRLEPVNYWMDFSQRWRNRQQDGVVSELRDHLSNSQICLHCFMLGSVNVVPKCTSWAQSSLGWCNWTVASPLYFTSLTPLFSISMHPRFWRGIQAPERLRGTSWLTRSTAILNLLAAPAATYSKEKGQASIISVNFLERRHLLESPRQNSRISRHKRPGDESHVGTSVIFN